MGELSLNLSQTRQARGLTLDDAERSTRIATKFLIALEDHNYSIFPAPVYARGFLRSYCRYLGIDPEPQLAELPQGWASAPPVQTEPVRTARAHRLTAEYLVDLEPDKPRLVPPNDATRDLRDSHRGVFLMYPVRDQKTDQVSVGFELLFPRNQIGFDINFTVRRQAESSRVVVRSS